MKVGKKSWPNKSWLNKSRPNESWLNKSWPNESWPNKSWHKNFREFDLKVVFDTIP